MGSEYAAMFLSCFNDLNFGGFFFQKTADIGGSHTTSDFLECLKEEIGQVTRI